MRKSPIKSITTQRQLSAKVGKLFLISESDDILKILFEHQTRLELTCRFTWSENTICIWDNRSVIHFAIADFYPGRGLGYERIMDRIAIEGDQPH